MGGNKPAPPPQLRANIAAAAAAVTLVWRRRRRPTRNKERWRDEFSLLAGAQGAQGASMSAVACVLNSNLVGGGVGVGGLSATLKRIAQKRQLSERSDGEIPASLLLCCALVCERQCICARSSNFCCRLAGTNAHNPFEQFAVIASLPARLLSAVSSSSSGGDRVCESAGSNRPLGGRCRAAS